MSRKICQILLLLVLPTCLLGQGIFRGSYWKQYRKELVFGIGASNFLGELGGKDQIGTDFVQDLEIKATRFAVSAGYRYYIRSYLSVRGNLTYAVVSGDDALTNEPFRNNRNLHFKSDIIEGVGVAEFHLIEEKQGSRYKIKGTKGSRSSRVGLFAYGGIGLFYFNPKAQYVDGSWYNLRPLGTEGQGLEGGPDKYSPVSIAMPLGIGLKYYVNTKMRIGLDVGVRKTFTDYIDDVSGVYFDKTKIAEANGPEAAYFSDPSLVESLPGTGTIQAAPGNERGDPSDLDSYMFAQLTISYKLFKQRGFRRIRSRKSVPSF